MNIQRIPLKVDRKHEDRYLVTVSLADVAEGLGQPPTVIYMNVMCSGAVAGNHYHNLKREAFRAVSGRFFVALMDIATREYASILLDAKPESEDFRCIVIPPGVAHAVRCIGNRTEPAGRLEVFATQEPRIASDDFYFKVL